MSKITIEVLGEENKGVGTVPILDFEFSPDMKGNLSRAAGILLCAYEQIAEQFLSIHPAECKNCLGYKVNATILDMLIKVKMQVVLNAKQ